MIDKSTSYIFNTIEEAKEYAESKGYIVIGPVLDGLIVFDRNMNKCTIPVHISDRN
jgi:hypothetical protein